MLRFYASVFSVCYRDLTSATGGLILHLADGDGAVRIGEIAPLRESLLDALDGMKPAMHRLPLSAPLTRKVERLRHRISEDENLNIFQAEALLKELNNDFLEELTAHYFLIVDAKRRSLHEQKESLFGEAVEEVFPDVLVDVRAAARCLAYDEWTAAVFHLMRVLEKGLHDLARRLEVPMADHIEYEQWHVVIDQITSTIERMKVLPKSPEKSQQMQVLSDAAVQFRLFKEAWRDHVSHSRTNYDEREADRIWAGVRDFMQALAAARD